MTHRAGFVNIFGKPNAGKSTLLNALTGEKLAITSPKVQTTRHRILGILSEPDFQIVFSDTPGIITPKYKLQENMMGAVQAATEDADLALFIMDVREDIDKIKAVFNELLVKAPKILVINKKELVSKAKLQEIKSAFTESQWIEIIGISALQKTGTQDLLQLIAQNLPENPAFYPEDALTDRPLRFFISELIREKLYTQFRDEIPYQTTAVIRQFEEKKTLTKISADIVVERQSQKAIILGKGGRSIKQIGQAAREDIEAFLDRKVFLELHVKVRNKWRNKAHFLKEYGYH